MSIWTIKKPMPFLYGPNTQIWSLFVNDLDMAFAARLGQGHLFLALAKPGLVGLRRFLRAEVAGHTLFIVGVAHVLGQDRAAAGMAKTVRPLAQPVAHRDSAIKHETLTLPRALILRHLFEVFQDAALEEIDVLHSLPQQVIGGFFATDATGAEHRDPFVVKAMPVRLPPRGEIAKGRRLGIDRALKRANGDLVIVAGVDHRDIGALDQGVPLRWLDIMPDPGARIDIGLAHGDDLFLEPHFHPAKGLLGALAVFPLQ